jgi:hypothetical protein
VAKAISALLHAETGRECFQKRRDVPADGFDQPPVRIVVVILIWLRRIEKEKPLLIAAERTQPIVNRDRYPGFKIEYWIERISSSDETVRWVSEAVNRSSLV